jgi:hypothetical protein
MIPPVERDLLRLMLEHGNEMVHFVFSRVTPERFTHPRSRQLVGHILEHAESGDAWDVNTLIDEVDDTAFRQFVADLVFGKYEISKGWELRGEAPEEPDPAAIAERCILFLRKQQIDELLKENQRLMKAASSRGEPVKEFLERHQALVTEKKELSLPGDGVEGTPSAERAGPAAPVGHGQGGPVPTPSQ